MTFKILVSLVHVVSLRKQAEPPSNSFEPGRGETRLLTSHKIEVFHCRNTGPHQLALWKHPPLLA
jgi:hypothetical protein